MVLIWEPITDLPEDWSGLSDGELGPLLQFWNDQRKDLEESGVLADFAQRLAREWSIETGQIEGVYQLDRGITQTLIEKGINADLIPSEPGQKPPELIAAIIQDHADVLEGLFQFVRGERPISKSYIHELHSALLRRQDTTVAMDEFGNLFDSRLKKGRYKERPNNPRRPDGSIHQYCPPEQVDPEMERLLAMHADHDEAGVPAEVEAAWLHHRFTQIHPYQDGNGRVARALASLVFMRSGWFPVVVTRDDRSRYIDSLEVADGAELRSLVSIFVDVQKRALFQAMQAAADVQQVNTVYEAVAAIKQALVGPGKTFDPRVWLAAKDSANRLMALTEKRLKEIFNTLSKEISRTRPEFTFGFSSGGTSPISLPDLGYEPNKDAYVEMRELSFSGSGRIQVQAHAIGSKFRGLIGFVVLFWRQGTLAKLASKESFQVNYAESYESAERRFRPWLEESLVNALTMWRKSL